MAGTIVADQLEAASTSTLVIKNGVANTPPTIQDSAGTQIGTFCRAWVNFNGTGTVAIRASFNVTSITDNGTGDYTLTLVKPSARLLGAFFTPIDADVVPQIDISDCTDAGVVNVVFKDLDGTPSATDCDFFARIIVSDAPLNYVGTTG